jgi:hypothetical protein
MTNETAETTGTTGTVETTGTDKVSVTTMALEQRIRRALRRHPSGARLHRRGGVLHIVEGDRAMPADLVAIGRELDVLHAWEVVA